MSTTSKVQEILREYIAPLEDNYGKTTYDAVVASIELKVREAIAEEQSFIWRLGWQKDGKQVYTFYGSNCTQDDMENACERIAQSPWKRPVSLEKVVKHRVWAKEEDVLRAAQEKLRQDFMEGRVALEREL